MRACFDYKFIITLIWIQSVYSISLLTKHSSILVNSDTENELADFISSKGYLPNENDLSKSPLIKINDNDPTYLLSKLSDAELVKLLSMQPKKSEYDLNDIVKIAIDSNTDQTSKVAKDFGSKIKTRVPFNDIYEEKKRFKTVTDKPPAAYFRLDDRPVDVKSDVDPNYVAYQKLTNILSSRPSKPALDDEEDEDKKELLFDVLVSQLKTLCCKKKKHAKKEGKQQLRSLLELNEGDLDKSYINDYKSKQTSSTINEHLFLIINDEIKSNGSDEIISVDPDSLESNSSVLLLGPITTPMTDKQLKLVMNRIGAELSKPEYVTLLQQLSDGSLSDVNVRILKSLVSGPETRRYIKPHRCNNQSKLARIYGGPKWIICTGYLNLNRPSIYD